MSKRIKIINSNKKMTDWRLQLAEDLKIASSNVRKMRRKVFSYDEVIAEFKRVGHKDLMINNYTLGADLNGIYFLDNKKNINYLFLIIKTDELVPVDNNTRRWDSITVNDYLMSLTENIVNGQLEQLSYELKSTETRAVSLRKTINKTVDYLNRAAAKYNETAKLGAPKAVVISKPDNINEEVIEEDEE